LVNLKDSNYNKIRYWKWCSKNGKYPLSIYNNRLLPALLNNSKNKTIAEKYSIWGPKTPNSRILNVSITKYLMNNILHNYLKIPFYNLLLPKINAYQNINIMVKLHDDSISVLEKCIATYAISHTMRICL